MMFYVWSLLARRDKALVVASWCVGLLLSICMLFVGQKIRFWSDHTAMLQSDPLSSCYDVVPWLVLFGLLSWMRVRLSAMASVNLEVNLQLRLMHHVLHLFPTPAHMLNRFVIDIPTIADSVTHKLSMGVRHLFFCCVSFVMMWLTCPALTLSILGIIPVMVIPFVWRLGYLRLAQQNLNHEREGLSHYVQQCLRNITTIQAFSQEKSSLYIWKQKLSRFQSTHHHHGRQRALVAWWVVTSISLGFFGVILIGTHYIAMTIGDLTSFIFYAVLCVGGLTALNNIVRDLMAASTAISILQETLAQPLSCHRVPQRHFTSTRGVLACHHVHFAYESNPDYEVLRGVSLTAIPGELVALVGKSGAGKSTLFSLLLGFYRPQKGAIYLDGVDIQKVSLHALRERIGFVEQEPVLFDGTLYDNIVYGKPTATRKEVYEAMEESGITRFLDQFPHHELTNVHNIALSGGQKQCVALARALIRKPSLFLLDEPTSALDAESEALIQESFKRVSRQHTTIMIAHRLSSVVQANKILVLDDGLIKAEGVHADLVHQSPLYRRFVMQQFPSQAL